MSAVGFILDALLALVVLSALVAASQVSKTRKVRAAMDPGALVILAVVGFTNVGLWIWLAVVTDRWQFAAIALAGLAISTAANLGSDKP